MIRGIGCHVTHDHKKEDQTMKKLAGILGALLISTTAWGDVGEATVSDLELRGEIEGENIVFDLSFNATVTEKETLLPLVLGDVAYLDGDLPRGSEIVRRENQYLLKITRGGWWGSGTLPVRFRFASRAIKEGEWRHTQFSIPAASIRRISVVCDRDDLEVRFPDALNVVRQTNETARTEVTAFLGIADSFRVQWKPEVKKLDAELVVSCEANAIATASVGAMRLDTILTYRIIQGSLRELVLDLPDVNVTQVTGEDIQGWRIDRDAPQGPRLVVALSRPREEVYRLRVECEMVLPKFPSRSTLPVLTPRDAIRTSGFLLVGTDSAIKLQVARAAGLTQVDLAAFPTVSMADKPDATTRPAPTRSLYAYQYASAPYALEINADDIVTTFTTDNNLVLTLADNELTLDASIEIDVKDAPAREIRIETDPDPQWTVTSVTGQHVSESDTDVRIEDGRRIIDVPFRQAVHGTALITIRMERSLKQSAAEFAAPQLTVLGAKAERGYLVVSAEKGARLKASHVEGLREVHTGSARMRVPGAQQAFRFKASGWALRVAIERTIPSIDTEVFHLVSLGEGVMYCSAAITYHISGAPVQEFLVRVPKSIETLEFTGADIEGWRRDGDVCTVRLQTKIMGDYTLLATFDQQFDYAGATIKAGGIETIATDSEVGYIALASSASLELKESDVLPGSIIRIDRDEIPSAYSSPVNDPIIHAYKYVKNPHTVSMRIQPFDTEPLLGQIADYVKLVTQLSKKGGAVTTGTYYLKNASRQYLMIRVPKDVDLWTIKQINENGQKEDLLSQEQGDVVLIPVHRPENPNTAIALELVYAQPMGELGFWASGVKGVRLDAPTLLDTHATFASWRVDAPSGFAIASSDGNMSPETPTRRPGMIGVLRKVRRIGRAMCRRHYPLKRALTGGFASGQSREFIRSVNLAGERPLSVELSVVPAWMGADSSARLMLTSAAIGLGLLGLGLARRKSRAIAALALTAIVFGVTQSAAGRSAVAVAIWILIAFLLVRYGLGAGCRLCCGVGRVIARSAQQVWRLLVSTHSAWRRARARAYARKLELHRASQTAYDMPPPFEPVPDTAPNSGPDGGFVTLRWLLPLTIVILVALAGWRASASEAPPAPVMDQVTIALTGPATSRDAEQSADALMTLAFSVDSPVSFVVIPNRFVLTDYALHSRHAAITSSDEGYVLTIRRAGAYNMTLQFRTPVEEVDQRWTTHVPILTNMRNHLTLVLPEKGMDIRADQAVLLRSEDSDTQTTAEAVFGPVQTAVLSWRPRMRKTILEEVVFFSEVNTLASLLSGVVDLKHVVHYQVAQGELRELTLRIPAGMSVTAMNSPNLATWSFDPETHLLEAILKQPVTGDFKLHIQTQVSSEGLPYSAVLGALDVQGSARQRGALAIAAPDAVHIRVGETLTVNPMNIEDFPAATAEGHARPGPTTIRRAFRYDQPASVAITVNAERVLPEIRVQEHGALSIADERIVLSTRLTLQIAKSGIFSARLGIPADFDVETLTGTDVSHWDEVAAGEAATNNTGQGRAVTVHFNRHVNDQTAINLVMARMEKGIEAQVPVPRVHVADARKHAGRLTITGERGVRMMVESHRGVDIKKASEAGITQAGVLVFDILRPTWDIVLKTEIMAPLVKPSVLQWVDLTEGMLKCQAFVNYEIENAGVKTFRIQSPLPSVALSVTGRNIARVHEVDTANGIWQVDLHSKVENTFAMTVGFQVPFNHEERRVKVLPLKTVDTEGQRGYLVVTCGGRVQVVPDEGLEGLKAEDPRSIPKVFRAGDLSDAILCYRTVQADYELPLSVVRHESASVLPASITQVRMTSVVSGNRKLLTRLTLQLAVGDLRFLRMALPRPEDSLWTVFVNGKEVSTSRDEETYCIPLEEQEGATLSAVEVVYAGQIGGGGILREHTIVAPRFEGLPLNDIEWRLLVLPQASYFGFGGTMDLVRDAMDRKVFDTDYYMAYNKRQREATLQKARDVLSEGEQMAKVGRQQEAKKAFQQALNYSHGTDDLNEDARVQLRNVTKQQFKIGLVNRRGAVRFRNNIIDEKEARQMEGFQGGDFTQEYADRVEQQLTSIDNDALDVVAEKMIDQQAAAAGVVKAIRIAMPEHGKELRFARALQVDPAGELSISFKVSRGNVARWFGTLWPLLFVFLGLWWFTATLAPKKHG